MISAHASVFGGMDVQRLCHQKTQDTKATNNQLSSSSHSPPKVFVHGVRNAGHLLMLENYQEFNAAMAVASGREGDLPPGMPRSVEFICDEVAATASSNTGGGGADKVSFRSSSGMVVMNEKDAAKFFSGGRFNRRQSQQKKRMITLLLQRRRRNNYVVFLGGRSCSCTYRKSSYFKPL